MNNEPTDDMRLRGMVLDLATRVVVQGTGHAEILATAKAFEQYVEGEVEVKDNTFQLVKGEQNK